ncbi:MAG: CaiB/BaiF CoA transferase family protein [Halobacteriaceae archaeon]
MNFPLEGVTVADFTTAHQGPWATQKLGDMGADVVKVERYGGVWARDLTAAGDEYVDGASPFWLSANRSKRSLNLDLKDDDGHQVAMDLVAAADVVVENFRPGVMDRLGLSYDDVREVNEDVVYVSASGFGEDGPEADRPGQDLLMQSLTGIPTAVGHRDHPPLPVPFPIVDGHSAMQIVSYTLAALFHRERTGEGQRVTVNLLDSAMDSQCQAFTVELNMDREFERSDEGIGQKYLGAPYGLYETADGYVAIAMTPMDALAETLEMPELAEYEGVETYEHRDEIKRTIEAHTRERTSEDLLADLVEADIWAAAVNDFEAAAEHPQVEHNDILVDVEHPDGEGTFTTTGTPAGLSETRADRYGKPPRVGEHAEEVLRELGYDDETIADLVAREVTGAPS